MGAERNKKTESLFERYPAAVLAAVFVLCFLVNYLINRDVEIKSLYMDDLSNYYYYIRMNFWQYAFGVADQQVHYRPVSYAALYLICRIVTGHLERIVVINGLLQSMIGTMIFYILRKFGAAFVSSLLIAFLCLASHLSYFQMGQMIGPIESISMIFALIILYSLIRYVCLDTDPSARKNDRITVCLAFFLVVMTHERYIGLVVPIVLSFLMTRESAGEKRKHVLTILAVALLLVGIRFAALRFLIPVGTSKTDVMETFQLSQAIRFALDQVCFVFGFNAGPAYLTGIEHSAMSLKARTVVLLGALALLTVILVYFAMKIRVARSEEAEDGIYGKNFRIDGIFLVSIMMYIASSSVTIRLEMRWIYISFVAAMIYAGYMFTYIYRNADVFGGAAALRVLLILTATGFLMTRSAVEIYYHSYYYNIFFFKALITTNSLAENTTLKYSKDELEKRKVYLLSNNFELIGGVFKYFYEPFFGERRKGDGRIIEVIPDLVEERAAVMENDRTGYGDDGLVTEEEKSLMQAELLEDLLESGKAIILEEDPATGTYRPYVPTGGGI